MFVNLILWTATLSGSTTNYAPATKSEEASAEDCGSDNFQEAAATNGLKTSIPARSNRTRAVPFSAKLYRHRHGIENFFQKIKRYRRVATRYDKLAETFLGFVCLAVLITFRAKT